MTGLAFELKETAKGKGITKGKRTQCLSIKITKSFHSGDIPPFILFSQFTTVCDTINLYRNKLYTTTLSCLQPNLCPALLRNMRLTFSSGYCFIYILLMIGAAIEYPVMFMPYLAIQLITITLYTVLLVLFLIKNVQCPTGSMLLAYGFMIHNWVQCFCCFRLMLQTSDF